MVFDEGRPCERYGVFLKNKTGEEYEYIFRLFCPDAESVELSGDMNMWGKSEMKKVSENTFEAEIVSDVPLEGTCYRYRITRNGEVIATADPFSRYLRRLPGEDSIIYTSGEYRWSDSKWRAERRDMGRSLKCPINIYDVDLKRWKTDENPLRRYGYLCYSELGDRLSEYITNMGYTHMSVRSLIDHASGDGITGYFAPLAIHGRPDELKSMIDKLHNSGIAVMTELEIDRDAVEFFGGDPARAAKFYGEVVSFWMREFHIDGFKINGCGLPAATLREIISEVNLRILEHPIEVLSVAGKLECDISDLLEVGFDLVPDKMLFESAADVLRCSSDLARYRYGRLGYSLMNSLGRSSVFIIDEDHVSDETLLCQMDGDADEKFARVRLLITYMMLHPGKKSAFMGCEIGSTSTVKKEGQLQWYLTDYPKHSELSEYVKKLNEFYRSSSELWQEDDSWRGFEWYTAGSGEDMIMSFARIGSDGKRLLAILNFSDRRHTDHVIGVGARLEKYSVVFSTHKGNIGEVIESDADGNVILTIPPHSARILKPL